MMQIWSLQECMSVPIPSDKQIISILQSSCCYKVMLTTDLQGRRTVLVPELDPQI